MAGKLTVICGPMYAEKTETVLRFVRRAFHADLGVQIFSSSVDTRHEGKLVSHAGTNLKELKVPFVVSVVSPGDKFSTRVRNNVSVVVIDEVQFFDLSAVKEILTLVQDRNVSVFASGLDRDYLGNPFGIVPLLLAHADEVQKLTAICANCKNSNATMTHRFAENQDLILIGGKEAYQPLCRDCWLESTR